MDPQQRAFLEHIGLLIPKLFNAIRLGNVKSEYVLGDRIIGRRQVRLKLVAEVVDPGSNPLATHSQLRAVGAEANVDRNTDVGGTKERTDAPATPEPAGVHRRGPRRKHPLSH